MRNIWVISTLILGLIPLIARLMVYILSSSCSAMFILNPVDISFLALSLNWANISESFHLFFAKRRNIHNIQPLDYPLIIAYLGISLVFIVIVAGILMCLYITDANPSDAILNPISTLICVSIISVISGFLSYTFIGKINVILYGSK